MKAGPETDLPVTYLFVPGDRPERFGKALSSGADRAILDLEDAVRPDAKAAARRSIDTGDLDWRRVVVRINDAASPFFDDDCAWLPRLRAAAVMVPKAEGAETLRRVAAAMGRDVELIPQIETVRGLHRLGELFAVAGVRRVAFGHLDFALDLGAAPDPDALALARSMLVMQSRLHGSEPPIDSVTTDLRDPERLRRDAVAARRFGFGGKLLIHPSQVVPVAEAFAPTPEERAWAERVVAAVAEGGAGAVALDGRMIDRPVEDAARRILERARRRDASS